MARNGMVDTAIAEALGVSYSTFKLWVARHPTLKAALTVAKQVADDTIEYSLYRQAQDRYVEEEEIKVVDGQIVKVMVRRCIPANVTATAIWLYNRRRDNYQRNPEPEIEAPSAPADDAIEVTADNVRQYARRFALVLVEGGKKTA